MKKIYDFQNENPDIRITFIPIEDEDNNPDMIRTVKIEQNGLTSYKTVYQFDDGYYISQ